MKKKYFILLLLFLFVLSIYGQGKRHNNIIVYDITGSMLGFPLGSSSKNIWNETLNLLRKQLNSFPQGENITIYLFGEDIINIGSYKSNTTVTSIIISKIDSIRVNNQTQSHTCIYKTLNTIINNLDSTYINTIYLFTDGRNSDGFPACGNIRPIDLVDNWERATHENEYLYIFKLKDFNLPPALNGNTIEIINDAFRNLNVIIEPINTLVRVSKNNMESSQQFRITGTGLEYMPNNLRIRSSIIDLRSDTNTERAYTIPGYFIINDSIQTFLIQIYNQIENISSGVYHGELHYVFDNNQTRREIIIDNDSTNLIITIRDIITKVIFKNEIEPTVTIEFVD